MTQYLNTHPLRLLIFIFIIGVTPVSAQNLAQGQWQGLIEYQDEDVPFTFEFKMNNDAPEIILINGEERISLEQVVFLDDSVFIKLTPFDAEIRAKYESHKMEGYWKKGYRKTKIPFKASYGIPRFDPNHKNTFDILKKWSFNLRPPEGESYPGIGLFDQAGSRITGSILTDVGDFRYFEGILKGDSIKISSFDGAHAFLLKGYFEKNRWSGKFYFDAGYVEDWEAVYDENASLTSQFSKIEDGQRPYYDILTAGDPEQIINPDDYFDKVLIIQLFGTWCPNSMDQTHYLVDWYKKNNARGVELIAISYEPNFSIAYGNSRISQYKRDMNVPYDIFLGGKLSKGEAALAFPFMDKISAFPTLIILDKFGFARYKYNYFNGPATGDYFNTFDREFNLAIDELLAE